MSVAPNPFIDDLVDDLRPVRPLRLAGGLGLAGASLVLNLGAVAWLFGLRGDLGLHHVDPVVMLSAGLFLILGIASAFTVVVMGRPNVGSDHGGWVWAAVMAALLPLTALLMGLGDVSQAAAAASAANGLGCLLYGSLLGLLTGVALTLWLRRGAPTSPERAGLLTGIAAGSLGIFAFTFHCPFSDIYHIGLWHSLVVVVGAALGRVLVPPLVRW